MKKVVLAFISVFIISVGAKAQVEPHGLGARFGGGNYGAGLEISYQHGLGDANRLEFDLGWSSNNSINHTRITGLYQWVWVLDGGLNWYAGPGAQFVMASANGSSASAFGIGGIIGVEYNFNENDVPLLISLDTRPMFHFGDQYFDSFGWGIALGIRYTF